MYRMRPLRCRHTLMRLASASLLLALSAAPAFALAQESGDSAWSVEGEIAATSDYVWRGVTQTDGKPALMGEITVSHESGFYAGAWVGGADTGDPESGVSRLVRERGAVDAAYPPGVTPEPAPDPAR